MAQTKFAKKVEDDIGCYFQEIGKSSVIFSNELHLQMHLAQYLQCEKGHRLHYEYRVPSKCIKDKKSYPWLNRYGNPQEMYFDLVVYDENEFVPIEIKYKTRSLGIDATIFNRVEKGVDILRNQGAQDLGMYGFWKDVYRLELVRDIYPTVKNGIALFVTNDPYYPQNDPESSVNHYHFRMTDGRKVSKEDFRWVNKNSKTAKKFPAFKVKGVYEIQWHPIDEHSLSGQRNEFHYCLITI